MAMAQMTTALPSTQEMELARTSGQRLASIAAANHPLTVRVRDKSQEQVIELPSGAVQLLLRLLENMASGRAVTIMARSAELTTQQAADVLNVSRPFLVTRLLETRKIPYHKVGTHRRIRLDDVLRYKERIDKDRRQVLDELAAQAQELGLGY